MLLREERERADRAEERHQRAMALYMEQAQVRGEDVSPLDAAMGLGGRTIAEVMAAAVAAGDREDAIAAAREAREGTQRLHVEFGEPVIHTAVSPVKRAILKRSRRWNEYQERKRQAEQARVALDEERRIPLRQAVQLNREQDTAGAALYFNGRPVA